MARNVLTITNAEVRLGQCPSGIGVLDPATLTDYSCQITEARITASANTISVPATFCAPASDTAGQSSYALELNGLQDWGSADSLSEYLFANDSKQICFALYIDGSKDPRASGKVTAIAGDFGGPAGTDPLTFSSTLPILGKPTITKADGTPVGGSSATFVAGALATVGDLPADAGDGSVYLSSGAGKHIFVHAAGAWKDTGEVMTLDAAGAIESESDVDVTTATPKVASKSTTEGAVVVTRANSGAATIRVAQYHTSSWAWVGAAFG
jgi:hypothetical protein